MQRIEGVIHQYSYVKFYPINRNDAHFSKILEDLSLDGFFCPNAEVTLEGYNSPSSAYVDIPLMENFDNLYWQTSKQHVTKEELNSIANKRDQFHKYLLENKWIQLEIYAIESEDILLEQDKDLINSIIRSGMIKTPSSVKIYKLFDGLGTSPIFSYNLEGHYIRMKCFDRMILLQNYIFSGVIKNSNPIEAVKKICDQVGLNFISNGGFDKSTNWYIQENKKDLTKQYKPLAQNIGKNSEGLNESGNDNLLIHSEDALSVLKKIAKMENAVFQVKGKNLYFGGIDKDVFSHSIYTWGLDIYSLNLERNIPKALKNDDHHPYYIELTGFDAGLKKSITVIRGKKPPLVQDSGNTKIPKEVQAKNVGNFEQSYLKNNSSGIDAGSQVLENISKEQYKEAKGNTKAKKRTGKADESSNTIFIYEHYVSATKKQLEKIADNIESAILNGAIEGTIVAPIDFTLEPFDTTQIRNTGREFENMIFNIGKILNKFSNTEGFIQTISITSGYDNIFEGEREKPFKAQKKKIIKETQKTQKRKNANSIDHNTLKMGSGGINGGDSVLRN